MLFIWIIINNKWILVSQIFLGFATMVCAQYNRYPYNPDYYGRRFAILRQTQNSSPDGSYSYRWDRPST